LWNIDEITKGSSGITLTQFIDTYMEKDIRKKIASGKAMAFSAGAANGFSPAHMFENTTDRFPEKLALIFEAERLTFRQLDEAANQVANFLLGQGLKKGDVVAIDMDNKPEFLTTWLGVAKAGGCSSFINNNLKGMASLLFSFLFFYLFL